MTATSYRNNLDTIADSPRDVILSFNFLAFHIPVMVSTKIAKPIRNSMPDIGKKKADTTDKSWIMYFWIVDNRIANCTFIIR